MSRSPALVPLHKARHEKDLSHLKSHCVASDGLTLTQLEQTIILLPHHVRRGLVRRDRAG